MHLFPPPSSIQSETRFFSRGKSKCILWAHFTNRETFFYSPSYDRARKVYNNWWMFKLK